MQWVIHEWRACPSPGSSAALFDVDVFVPLVSIGDIQELVIYGSWVRLLVTDSAAPAHDLDVLVVGSVDRRVAYEEIRLIEQRISLPVDSVFLLPEEMDDTGDPFLAELLTSPHIHIGEGLSKWI
jgi:hypothetical protein